MATEDISSRYVLNDIKKMESVQGRDIGLEEKEEGGYCLERKEDIVLRGRSVISGSQTPSGRTAALVP